MASRPGAAVLVPVSDISDGFQSLKVRTVGVLTSYDARTAHGSISRGSASLYIDFSLATESLKMGSLSSSPKVMVTGDIIKPDLATTGPRTLLLQAILVSFVEDLDLGLWEQAAREHSRALHNRAQLGMR